MRIVIPAVALALAGLAGPIVAQTQSPDTATLMRRVGVYASWFVNQFSNVVAEEEYEQRFGTNPRGRRLTSDFMLVGYPGRNDAVLTFRDVREVDGKPIGGQENRITRLFLEPFDDAVRRAQEIHREGLRLSIPNGRLMDPLTVIGYLQPAYQANFRVSRGGYERKLGDDIREVSLTPTANRNQTLLRPARAWVSEATGAVVRTELRTGFGASAQVTTTTFGVDPGLRIPVPLEMRDEVPRGRDDFIGIAKYSKFRRFEVRTDATVDVPPANP
jgi:hypothetical protein